MANPESSHILKASLGRVGALFLKNMDEYEAAIFINIPNLSRV